MFRSKRKTISIKINSKAEVFVYAPLGCRQSIIDNFLSEKSNWINNNITKMLQKRRVNEKYRNLESFLLFGNEHNCGDEFKGKTNNLSFNIKKFLINKCKNYLPEKISQIANNMHLQYNNWFISNARKKWGSCDSKKNLRFVYKIICLPEHLMDYIIVHELAHLKFMDHSKAFWNYVQQYIPDVKNCKKQLKHYAFLLELY